MPDPISPAGTVPAPLAGTAPVAAPQTAPATASSNLSSDTFLQLLVAQLKYQDPSSPADSTQFLAQTAQFTMVEKLSKLAEQSTSSYEMNRNLGAAGLVGREVEWTDDAGAARRGTVTAARLGSKGPVLVVGTAEVGFDRVAVVRAAPAAPTAPPPAATPTAS